MRLLGVVASLGFVCEVGCAGGGPAAIETETRTSALVAQAGQGPLAVGQVSPLNSIFLASSPTNFGGISEAGGGLFNSGDGLAAGDLDGDGLAEIVVAHRNGGLAIFNQAGDFVSPVTLGLELPNFSAGGAIAIGDLNHDGAGDIVVGTPGTPQGGGVSSGFVTVAFGKGATDANIEQGLTEVDFVNQGGLVVCDIDHDGFDDIVVAPSFVTVSGATGRTGRFLTTDGSIPGFIPGFSKLACGDLNNDGFADLIVATVGQGQGGQGAGFQVFTNPSLPPVNFFSPGFFASFDADSDIAAGDIDGDGFAEVAIGQANGTSGGGILIVSAPGKTPPITFGNLPAFFGGDKLAIPHLPPGSTSSDFTVPYVVQAILYAPPFNQSSTTYATQTTLSTQTTWSSTAGVSGKTPGKVTLDGTPMDVIGGLTFTASILDNDSIVTQASSTTGDGSSRSDAALCAPTDTNCIPNNVDPPHGEDVFLMVFEVNGKRTDFTNLTSSNFVFNLSTGKPFRFNVSELEALAQDPQDLSIFVDQTKLAEIQKFITPADAQQLLALDPYVSGIDITQHPERFEPACDLSLGPCTTPERMTVSTKSNSPCGLPTTCACPANNPTLNCSQDVSLTVSQAHANSTASGSGFSILGGLNFSAINFMIQFQDVTTNTVFNQFTASVTLKNSSLCEAGTVDLWMDKMFGSLLWVTNLVNNCQQQPMATLSFESLADWQVQGGGSATLSNISVTDASSFSVAAQGWTPLVSGPLNSAQLRSLSKSSNLSQVSFELEIPTAQPNPYWIGAAQMYISAPSANVYNAYMGQVELTGLPQGRFGRLEFTIPAYAMPALTGDHADVTFTIVLNVNAGTSGWLVDDLEIGE